MVALTSVLRDKWVRTRALYSASFCRRKADGRADFARKRSDNMIDPAEANETYSAASAIAAFDAIKPPNCSPSLWKRFPSLSRHLGSKANEVLSVHCQQVGKEREPLGRGVSSGSFLAPAG